VVIDGMGTGAAVDHLHDDICFVDRRHNLPANEHVDRLFRIIDHSAGVDDEEVTSGPFCAREVTIAGDPGTVFDDGQALAENPIEKGRFPHIWAADDCDYRKLHGYLSIWRDVIWKNGSSAGRRLVSI
jgi:hypothetical protein